MKYTIATMIGLVCLISCGGRSGSGQKKKLSQKSSLQQVRTAVEYGYKIINTYPHDTGSYTQGLFWHDGFIYESTGEYGRSAIKKVVPQTGKAIQINSLDAKYFGEGAVMLEGKIYQLTWLEGTVLVYDVLTFENTGSMSYSGEGWGLTTDGEKLYMSDGSANITVRDPKTFRTERVINVHNGATPVSDINELEWVDGKIWANLYITDPREISAPKVVIIDPKTGDVDRVIDFAGIYSLITVTPSTDVMNGIAHDPETGRIFVTGKRWNKLFEIEIFKK